MLGDCPPLLIEKSRGNECGMSTDKGRCELGELLKPIRLSFPTIATYRLFNMCNQWALKMHGLRPRRARLKSPSYLAPMTVLPTQHYT